jgi:hypothetical protein
MPLYIPKLGPAARPPVGFPPVYRSGFDAFAAVLMLPLLAVGFATLSQMLPRTSAPMVVLSLAAVSGFAYVSKVALARPHWWQSRYETISQLALLVGMSLAFPALLGSAAWLHEADGSHRSFTGVCLRALAFQAAAFVGLHLVYADGSAFLQAFGCKWSDHRRWGSCTSGELLLGAIILAAGGTMLVGQMLALALHPQAALVACAKTAAFAACIAVPAFALRSTHAVHPHHYAGALLLLPVASAAARFSCVSVFVEGLVWGLLVEGAATWGMDPLLVPHVVPAGVATDYPTTVWVSVVSSFARPRANAAVALALLELLSTLAPLCDSLAKAAGDKVGGEGDGEVADLFRVLSFGEPAEVLVRQLTGVADGGRGGAQPTFASSKALKSGLSARGLEAPADCQLGVWLSDLEALRARLRALLAGSCAAEGWSSRSARVAAFVLLSSVYGALRAGAVEIRQSILVQAAGHPADVCVEGALPVLAALCAGAELLPSRRAFDTEHVRWRGARDACEELCVKALDACGAGSGSAACVGRESAELSRLLRELQQEVTRLLDVASCM